MGDNKELKQYKIYIFDMFGTIWNSKEFFPYVRELFTHLKNEGVILCVLSNASKENTDIREKFRKHNVPIDIVCTSGDIYRNYLSNSEKSKKIYILGNFSTKLFDNMEHTKIQNIEEADEVYVSTPQITKDELNELRENGYIFEENHRLFYRNEISLHSLSLNQDDIDLYNKENKIIEHNGEQFLYLNSELFLDRNGNYDSNNLDVFLLNLFKTLKSIKEKNIKIYCANPDESAQELNVLDSKINPVTRHGAVFRWLENHGCKGKLFGKPNPEALEYVCKSVHNEYFSNKYSYKDFEKIFKQQTCMVGDLLFTDIKVANNFGIDSILLIDLGLTKKELEDNNNNLQILFNRYDAIPTYIYKYIADIYEKYMAIETEEISQEINEYNNYFTEIYGEILRDFSRENQNEIKQLSI